MPPTRRPNVLVIMSDQHHPHFMGCAMPPGQVPVQTPHLDALARRGSRFSSAYCPFPLCCPSRMSFMTAQLPSTIGVLSNHTQLGSDVPTFAHLFNEAGYESILCGRMHFNGPDQRHGFQRRLIGDVHGIWGSHVPKMREILSDTFLRTTGPSAESIRISGPGVTGYQAYDEAVFDAGVAYLRHRGQTTGDADPRPFAMVLSCVLPHAPFAATPEDYALYEDLISDADLPDPHLETLHPANVAMRQRAGLEDPKRAPSREDQRRARIAYYGLCTHVDRNVGRLLTALAEAGLEDDTIVVYTSDHGESLGEHGMWWKHSFYESSIGVPMIIAGPGIPAGAVVPHNVSLIDVGPTLLDVVGAEPIPGAQGQSFHSLLGAQDKPAWHDTVIAENLWPTGGPSTLHRMIRRGPWKLCHYPGHPPELYNLQDDPDELENLASDPAHEATRDALMADLLAGWDHDAIMQRRQFDERIEGLTRLWRDNCADMPEPDACWYDTPPVNRLDVPSPVD